MMDKHLKRRPTWMRYIIIISALCFLMIIAYIKRNIIDNNPADFSQAPAILFVVGMSFAFAVMTEMATTLRWNDQRLQMYNRWGFGGFDAKTITLNIAELTAITDIMVSAQMFNDLPFSGIEFSDGVTTLPVMTRHFIRAGLQEFIQDVARLRPELPLTENLQSYINGDFDGYWPS